MEINTQDQHQNLAESSLRLKNKELTKRKLIEAVSFIIRTEGYTGLGVNKIARQAGVHKN